MRRIYVDEAGTSKHEPYRVVAGVQIVSDEQAGAVERAMQGVINMFVPESLRKGFIFHGTEVFSGGKRIDRNIWPLEGRLRFFQAFLSIPLVYKCPIHIGAAKAGALTLDGADPAEVDHMMAFCYMLWAANRSIVKRAPAAEKAIVVCERLPEREKAIRNSFRFVKSEKIELDDSHVHTPPDGYDLANLKSSGERLLDAPAFAEKRDSPILQLADACAFAFRHYLRKGKHGTDLLNAAIGVDKLFDNWCNPAASVTYYELPRVTNIN